MTDTNISLKAHLEAAQGAAYLAESLVSAIVTCVNVPRHHDLIVTLAEEAEAVLKGLGHDLDSVNLEKLT